MLCKIYKIKSNNSPLIYIGSTKQKLETRLKGHIKDYKYRIDYNNWLYSADLSGSVPVPDKFKREPTISSYKILQYGNYSIELLDEFEYEIKSDILKREQFYINLYKDICVNENKAWGSYNYIYKHGINEKKLKKDALENYVCKTCNNIGHDTSWIKCCNYFKNEYKSNKYTYNNYNEVLKNIKMLSNKNLKNNKKISFINKNCDLSIKYYNNQNK